MPAEFKRRIDEQPDRRFMITSKDGERADIFPMAVWEEIEQKLAAIPEFDRAKMKLMDRYNFYGQEAEMDAQGRVLLPQILRKAAGLEGDDVVVLGNQKYLTVVNLGRFVAQMEANPLTDDDLQKLAGSGL